MFGELTVDFATDSLCALIGMDGDLCVLCGRADGQCQGGGHAEKSVGMHSVLVLVDELFVMIVSLSILDTQRYEVAQAVELEEQQAGMTALQLVALQGTKQRVPQTDRTAGQTAGGSEQSGVAAHLVTKLPERAQAFLGLGQEVGIGLEDLKAHGIVDVVDVDG